MMCFLSLLPLPHILKPKPLGFLKQRFLSPLLHPLPFPHCQQSLILPLLSLPNLRLFNPLNLSHLCHWMAPLFLSPLLLRHHSPCRLTTLSLTSFRHLADHMVFDRHLVVPCHVVLSNHLCSSHGGQLPSCGPPPCDSLPSPCNRPQGKWPPSCAPLIM